MRLDTLRGLVDDDLIGRRGGVEVLADNPIADAEDCGGVAHGLFLFQAAPSGRLLHGSGRDRFIGGTALYPIDHGGNP